jgi:hypothetical protein
MGPAGIVRALEGEGRLISVSTSPWEVQALGGASAQMGNLIEVILKPVYEPHGHVAGHAPLAVPAQVWTSNFGPTRLLHVRTFLEGKLMKIEPGDDGR